MTPKQQVITVYPNAYSFKTKYTDKWQWRIYYTWHSSVGTPVHQMIGIGITGREAWKTAWLAIQKQMLEKLERKNYE